MRRTRRRVGAAVMAMVHLGAAIAVMACAGDRRLDRFPPWLEPCAIEGVEGRALCGTYPVFEDRAARAGRKLDLRVVVLPARGAHLPEPVFYLEGGPGAAATESAAYVASLLPTTREHRDLVFVDQRGTAPPHVLECPEPTLDGPLQRFFDEFLPLDVVRECRERLEQVADLRLYTTPLAIDDFDEVRQALDYEKLILFGSSYGTRAALVYLRRHPRSVSAAALKGVAPVDMRNPLPFARALDAAVVAVLDACVADERCRAAYPDPHADWRRVRAAFDVGPVDARVVHPRTGEGEIVLLSRGVFADGLRHLLYHVEGAAELPRLLHAAARGDFGPFAERELRQRRGFDAALADGVFLSVTCSEDLGFVREEEIARETSGTFLGDYRVRRQLAACEAWPDGAGVDESYLEPVRGAPPVLLLSGELDPATPVGGAERVARELPSALHLVVPSSSHGFTPGGCERRLLDEFLARGAYDRLDTECLAATRLPPFDTSPAPARR